VISELRITPEENSSKQIARDLEKFWKNSWRWEIKFGTLFPIDTFPKSPLILNYSKNSESKTV
jgi:hypothetical protein